jgi:PPOX class probable F420-dependent enzyme
MLNDEERALLDLPAFAKLVTMMPDGYPQITSMWYRRDGDTLRMIAPEAAQKSRNLDRNARASVLVDHPESGYQYVEMRCDAEVVHDDAAAREELLRVAERYIGDRAPAYVASLSSDRRVLIVLRPRRVRSHLRGQPMASGLESGG